jgi:2-oxopent-4-enoate/cis-2-oxohex-4-enoate hydratase
VLPLAPESIDYWGAPTHSRLGMVGEIVDDPPSLTEERKMNDAARADFAAELYAALRTRLVIAPLTEGIPTVTIDDANQISLRFLERRLQDGEHVIGKKIGVTSKVVMNMLNAHQPDFGFLTDRMFRTDDAAVSVSGEMIQPRAEGEIAFRLKKYLRGPGVTEAAVLAAIESVHPCFEIVDSRIRDWKIKKQDTVANVSCGMFVLGDGRDPDGVDFVT